MIMSRLLDSNSSSINGKEQAVRLRYRNDEKVLSYVQRFLNQTSLVGAGEGLTKRKCTRSNKLLQYLDFK